LIKIDKKYDIEKIRNEIALMLATHELVKGSQLMLQSPNGDDWYDNRAPYQIHPDLRETDFKKSNTPDDWEITRFINENGLCRTRLLKLKSRECYTWHKDVGHRIHLAVITNDKCFFVEHGQLQNIPSDGHPYMVDVGDYHTAMNCSDYDFDRIHLVGVIR